MALAVITIMALWKLLNLGTGCTCMCVKLCGGILCPSLFICMALHHYNYMFGSSMTWNRSTKHPKFSPVGASTHDRHVLVLFSRVFVWIDITCIAMRFVITTALKCILLWRSFSFFARLSSLASVYSKQRYITKAFCNWISCIVELIHHGVTHKGSSCSPVIEN